jgi:hypothetical protein
MACAFIELPDAIPFEANDRGGQTMETYRRREDQSNIG